MDKFDLVSSQIDRKVEEAIMANGQKKVYIDYSAYESDDDDNPIDNLDKIAVNGKVVLVRYADEFYGGKKSKDFRSPVLENPTWLQVAVQANRMIRCTRDTHHCFLESLYPRGKEIVDGVEINLYEFGMGS